MNQAQMMQQVRKMQAEMEKAQAEISATVLEGSAGGGAVTVSISGDMRVTKLAIAPAAVDPEDIETLEDLVTVAVNDALVKVKAFSEQRMGRVTGGLRIPGLM